MARAQTYIITKDHVYGYSSNLHYDNYKSHLDRFYTNLKITEHIPFLLSKNGECVIDIVSHGSSGSIYLPEILLKYQGDWILSRESYLGKFTWSLNDIENGKYEPYDEMSYTDIIKIIKKKRQL